jgi:hypothetical protein
MQQVEFLRKMTTKLGSELDKKEEQRRATLTSNKQETGMGDTDYCAICYTNEITVAPTEPNEMTCEFEECKHRFCVECVRESFKMLIESNQLD